MKQSTVNSHQVCLSRYVCVAVFVVDVKDRDLGRINGR